MAGAWTGGGPRAGENDECTKEDRINQGWPCYTEERPVVYCSGRYWNDYMYENVSKDITILGLGTLLLF